MTLLVIFLLMHIEPPHQLFRMTFHGADRELAQGAVERHDLRHREIEPRVWLVEVPEGSASDWAARLTKALPDGSGRFEGAIASAEEIEKVRRGEITLQR